MIGKKIRLTSSRSGVFKSVILLVVFLGFLLRGFSLVNNFTIGNDDARDLMIVSQAIVEKEIPPIGPFSSAGPFVTGPIYYWSLIASTIVLPFGLYDSWVFLLILSVLNIAVFAYIGFLIRGKKLAVFLSLLSATSLQLIHLSLNLTNPSFIPLLVSLMILSFILLIKRKKVIFGLLCGLLLGFALNMHYQAINLFIFLPFILLIKGFEIKKKIISSILFVIGFLIAMFPILWWDSHQGFSNINNILDYLLVAQYRIYVPNSWKIFIFNDMLSFWGFAAGGTRVFGLLGMIVVGIGGLIGLLGFKKMINKPELYLIPVIFFVLLFVNRFYHGQRSEVYLLYLTPFVLISIGIAFELILTNIKFIKKRWIEMIIYVIFTLFILGNVYSIYINFTTHKGSVSIYTDSVKNLKNKYPNTKFDLYDWEGRSTQISLPFSLFLKRENLQSNDGMKIAVMCIPSKDCLYHPDPVASIGSFPIADISTFSAKKINDEFINVNQTQVYESLIGWAKRHELKHTFNLKDFLIQKIKR